ncbi:MAG: LpqB family beta-propeller domain-containing protein [Actinomycetota bacterium]|nr:LpqB family beta-propeller domain-containing protein [Actinomycetota bacterium]
MNKRAVVGGLAVIALALAGCTGVPTSSAPETVGRVDVESATSTPPIVPAANADPRAIVSGFLSSNSIDPKNHTSARAFLAPATQRSWSDQTATILDTTDIGTYPVGRASVTILVRGRIIGSLNAAGVYTPSLRGNGANGGGQADTVSYPFVLRKVAGHWRIAGLRPGLLLNLAQFQGFYKERPLYFLDLAAQSLVPDARFTALDGADLDSWLVNQLAAGPRPELRNAVLSDTAPARAAARSVTVDAQHPAVVEIPGSSQLNAEAKRELAAQVSKTLDAAAPDERIQITDSGTPVRIPDLGGTSFTASDFSEYGGPPLPDNEVYYLRNGRIVDQNGKYLTGPLNRGLYLLKSVALSRQGPDALLTVAAETPAGLVVGNETTGFGSVVLSGLSSSRPAWAPGLSEVWISKGSKIFRLTVSNKTASAAQVSIPSLTGGGEITALRLSPEGSRIAIVIRAGGGAHLFIGSIVRTAGQVRIDALQSISPDGVAINDVAWIGELKLFAIGTNNPDGVGETFETNADGSFWTANPLGPLPHTPDSVTGATQQIAWVSVDSTVWVQVGRSWRLAGDSPRQTDGDKPVYLE